MAEKEEKGQWRTINGKHVFFPDGADEKEVMAKAFGDSSKKPEDKKAKKEKKNKELGLKSEKDVDETEMSDEEYEKEMKKSQEENYRLNADANLEPESDDKVKAYQFPPLNEQDLAKAKEYGLKLKAKFDDGDMVLTGSMDNLQMFADDYLDYELSDDYLYNDEDFDYEDLEEAGRLEMVKEDSNEFVKKLNDAGYKLKDKEYGVEKINEYPDEEYSNEKHDYELDALRERDEKGLNNDNGWEPEDDFVPMEYSPLTAQQKALGLSDYDMKAAVDEYNKTKGGKLIPHEETIKDLKQDIDWDLFDSEEDLEKGIDSILGGKYLTDDEKQQVRDYFKQKNPAIEPKKYEDISDEKLRNTASSIDAEIAKALPRLYREGYAGTQLSKDGDRDVLTFYAELGYEEMEKVMDKLDAKLKEMGIDSYFEMETSGRAVAYL